MKRLLEGTEDAAEGGGSKRQRQNVSLVQSELDTLRQSLKSDRGLLTEDKKFVPIPVLETCRVEDTFLEPGNMHVSHCVDWSMHPAVNSSVFFDRKRGIFMRTEHKNFAAQHHEVALLFPVRSAHYRRTRPLISALGAPAGTVLLTPFCFVRDDVLLKEMEVNFTSSWAKIRETLNNPTKFVQQTYNWTNVSPEFVFAEHVRRFLFDDGGIYKPVDGQQRPPETDVYTTAMQVIYDLVGQPNGTEALGLPMCRCLQIPNRAGRTSTSGTPTEKAEDRMRDHCALLQETLRNLAMHTANMAFVVSATEQDMQEHRAVREALTARVAEALRADVIDEKHISEIQARIDTGRDPDLAAAVGRFQPMSEVTPSSIRVCPVRDPADRNPWLRPLSSDTDISLLPLTLLAYILTLYDEAHMYEGVVEIRNGGRTKKIVGGQNGRQPRWVLDHDAKDKRRAFLREMILALYSRDKGGYSWSFDIEDRISVPFLKANASEWLLDGNRLAGVPASAFSPERPPIYFHSRRRISFVLGQPKLSALDVEAVRTLLRLLTTNAALQLSPWIDAQIGVSKKKSLRGGSGDDDEKMKIPVTKLDAFRQRQGFVIGDQLTDTGFRTYMLVYFQALAQACNAKLQNTEYTRLCSRIRMTSPMPIQAPPDQRQSLVQMLRSSVPEWKNDAWDYGSRSTTVEYKVTAQDVPGMAPGSYTLQQLERFQDADDLTKSILSALLRQLVPDRGERTAITDRIAERVLTVGDRVRQDALAVEIRERVAKFDKSDVVVQQVDGKVVQPDEAVRVINTDLAGTSAYECVQTYLQLHLAVTWPAAQVFQQKLHEDAAGFRPTDNILYHLRRGTATSDYWHLPPGALRPRRLAIDMAEALLVVPLHKSFGSRYETQNVDWQKLSGHFMSCIFQRLQHPVEGPADEKGAKRVYQGRVIVWDPLHAYDEEVRKVLEPVFREYLPSFQPVFVHKRRIQATMTVDCGFYLLWTLKQLLESLIPTLNQAGMKGIVEENAGLLTASFFPYGFDHILGDLNTQHPMHTLGELQGDIDQLLEQVNRTTMVYFRRQLDAAYDQFNPTGSDEVQAGIEQRVMRGDLTSPFG